MLNPSHIRRREFLAACAAAASPCVIPCRALGAAGKPGAGERLTVAHVGVGGMGSAHLGWSLKFREMGVVNIAAVCDVNERRLAGAVKACGPGCDPYRDYRSILQRQDIDAVIFATPDHWHAVQTVHACESGKHVYVEKPSSVTIEEGKAMLAAAEKHRRIVQVGSQARSAEPAHQVCTYVRNGMLGKIHTVKCWHSLNPTGGTGPGSDPPAELDWDLWLGPLRWRPFHSAYLNFRWLMESGGGVIRDRGAHVFSVIRWCMDADGQAPVSVEATGSAPGPGIFDCPPRMKAVFTFRNPDWQVIWEQPGESPEGDPGGFGFVFYGEQDRLVVHRDGTRIPAAERARKFKVPAGGVEVYRMAKHADYNMSHKEDWFQAIKTGKPPIMNLRAAHATATMCILANLSYVLGRKLLWDANTEQVVGDEQANRLLARPQRHPYHL